MSIQNEENKKPTFIMKFTHEKLKAVYDALPEKKREKVDEILQRVRETVPRNDDAEACYFIEKHGAAKVALSMVAKKTMDKDYYNTTQEDNKIFKEDKKNYGKSLKEWNKKRDVKNSSSNSERER